MIFFLPTAFVNFTPSSIGPDPCDAYGDCARASVAYSRANPDDSLYLGDQFSITVATTLGSGSSNGTGWSSSLERIAWSYDATIFKPTTIGSVAHFTVAGNVTGFYTITATVTFLVSITTCTTSSNGQTTCSTSYPQSSVPVSEQVFLRPFVLNFQTKLADVANSLRQILRNPDGSFYHNDSFCDSWNATFQFASERTDIKINVTSITPPSLEVLNYSANALGRVGQFCYAVRTESAYSPFEAIVKARALNWQGTSLGLRESSQPFAIVEYNPKFTTFAYMLYRNSTAPSSLQRPWVLLVRYDGNLPSYSYAGDENTHSFNGSRTLAERAYLSDFRYTTLSYQPYTSSGVFGFHVFNSTGSIQYDWLNKKDSAPLYHGKRMEKYVFNATAPSLSPLLSQGFIYQNVTMIGCWQHVSVCDLRQNYWLVPFLWNGRLNIVSVDSSGNEVPDTPITVTTVNPAPLATWLINNFKPIFGNDSQAIKAFEADLYPTNQTTSFSGNGRLSIWFNETSLAPPKVSITAGGVLLTGNFTFVPTFVDSPIASFQNSFNRTVFYANATIPLWSYSMVQGRLAYLPIATTMEYPSSFAQLLNSSSGWFAGGNTTAPETPSSFATQRYGFLPLGENLPIYANLQGGGIKLLGTQKIAPNEYEASFYIEPWSGGITKVQLIEGNLALEPQLTTSAYPYQSPLPPSVTGFYSVSYPATGQDTKVVFTNKWGAVTTIDLGSTSAPSPLINLVPATTVAAFGVAFIVWFIVSGILKTRRVDIHK